MLIDGRHSPELAQPPAARRQCAASPPSLHTSTGPHHHSGSPSRVRFAYSRSILLRTADCGPPSLPTPSSDLNADVNRYAGVYIDRRYHCSAREVSAAGMPPDVHQHPRPSPSCLPTTPCSGRPLRTGLVPAGLLDSSAARRFRYRDLSVMLRAPRSSRLPLPPSLCLRRLQARARAAFVSDAASNPLLLALAHRRVPDVSPQPPV
ncbi:hypothetical protein DFH08DRAFT_970775 [Mycena albidolilacea]|uniref:Uncharacterized protein n=1 Tax=Mycena albidolilacea TaxID=1033008 RepID=A0AAD6ZEN9_9AGAR|nr:hypothetical protein DFH08DRAFT_970775 [Mycena albidolilacea]